MKTLKTTISKSKYFLLALLVAFSFACNPEDGADGAAGADGAVGADGADGNANVQTFIFDTSSMSGDTFTLTIPAITQDVMDNDVILSYLTDDFAVLYPIPAAIYGAQFTARTFITPGEMNIRFNNWDGSNYLVSAGNFVNAKIIIIESTSTTTGRINSKQQVYNELNQAGVDINDYYAVCDYYGIAY